MTPKYRVKTVVPGAFATRFLDGWIIWVPNKGNLTPLHRPTPRMAWHYAWEYLKCRR